MAANAPSTSSERRPGGIEDHESAPYIIKAEIGKGSFATVYRGYHKDSRMAVAIKTVSRTILTPKLVDNLESEINILKQLKHAHITELIEIVKADRFIFLIMEDCTGGDLSGYLKRRGRVDGLQYVPEPGAAPTFYQHPKTGGLAEVAVRSFLRQMARALKFLRQRNLIHRDIKPQNLLLKPATATEHEKGHPLGIPVLKIADFGFARHLPNTMLAETLCGSPLYMAPEILRYEKYDAKADLWSVGAVLYEISVGKPPFRAQNHIELLKRIEQARSTVRFPDEEDPNANPVPADIKKLIRALLKRHPVERATFDEFFACKAMANSKFPAPRSANEANPSSPGSLPIVTPLSNGKPLPATTNVIIPHIPDNHRIIPPEVLDPKALVPPSNFHFRKAMGNSTNDGRRTAPNSVPPTPLTPHAPSPGGSPAARPSPLRRPVSLTPELSTQAEADEESFLKGEYVVIGDTKHVEFNQRVDELTAARQRAARRASATPSDKPSPPSSPAQQLPITSSPRRLATNALPAEDRFQFPPTPVEPDRPKPARAGSSALSRALNAASKKLWGTSVTTPTSQHSPTLITSPATGYPPVPHSSSPGKLLTSSPKKSPPLITNGTGPNILEREEKLLAGLENLAQKVEVITKWADELFEQVKQIPEKPLPDPGKFVPREGESPRHATRRRNAELDAEMAAINCISLYMLVMNFSQNGINRLHDHMDVVEVDGEPPELSPGFDDAVEWFGNRYERCSQRAQTVKGWLPEGATHEPPAYMDQVLFERALALSRNAARKEILDQNPWDCEVMYQDALWLLYTVRDDLEAPSNAYMEEDRSTIDTWITRTKLRHHRCKERAAMPDPARRKDAQADQNLDDVNRFPPPWDLQPLPSPSPSHRQ
ncbi:Serine/threonine-protein kinase ATG1 {ECO:0000250/UniProtKB:P53104} {ECO:0000250/UniProtKB:P53104}; AltName: Full=Autophagy-related protein 1 {ECO:0000250/UniProtKB:P53104} [Serendipita indica DSM 11827]|nr:Serine/threonine-protein kinase ATG1 {ECO:0000250/UniProtKB:P53104} {ECO:0000250/UniProtKB:P53104}; AltName: Full=Autophagy-related protein 1 {ECO:0000250/UniProtKB:P53104} [Serendipita indica DSM 11827]